MTPGHTTAQYWPDPGNWNELDNTVECWGSGGSGNYGDASSTFSGGGGGGGAYAKGTNLVVAFPVPYVVCPRDCGLDFSTTFNSSTPVGAAPAASKQVRAGCGQFNSGSYASHNGNPGATYVYPSGYWGGDGGTQGAGGGGPPDDPVLLAAGDPGGGGGGAGGPLGIGYPGNTGSSGYGGAGGSANNNTVPGVLGGRPGSIDGLPGNSGATGSGSGGGGAAPNGNGGAGGNYGGGGGGRSANWGVGVRGQGANGLMIINYTPLAAPQPRVMIMV